MFYDLIVIGGGASGLVAAFTAHDLGRDVCLLEGTDRVGKKILATGNGRCNVTNQGYTVANYHSSNRGFPDNVLNTFNLEATINMFASLGLPLVALESGKMYPMSLQATAVLDVLRLALEDRGIPLYNETKVNSIKYNGKTFTLSTTNETFTCKKLIIATGGKTAPKTGSDGSGYELAKSLGHKVIRTLPAIVQLKLDCPFLKALSGVKFNGFAEVFADGQSIRREYGEILFTDYGISGPPILQVSRVASEGLYRKMVVTLKLDMMPQFTEKELKQFLENHFRTFETRPLLSALTGILNKKIIPTVLKQSGIENLHTPCSTLSWKEKAEILKILKGWTFNVSGTNSFNEAQVTVGGIDTTDVSPITLESKLIPGLYFCGEVLDVDGDCGGYNLQWAWSSGSIAGSSAAISK